jgi:hypothetical protein
MRKRWGLFFLTAACARACFAASVTFEPRELFRVPFGQSKDTLGAKIDAGNFIIPRDFSMDGSGHFYIYDPNKHRIVRFSPEGRYQMEFRYLVTAGQVFAHADSRENLWLMISDPAEGMFYGVYDSGGKVLRSGIFSRFNRFRLHVDDDGALHVILSSEKNPASTQTYLFDEKSLLMKKENIAQPPENHHQIRRSDHTYFIDQVPDGSKDESRHVNHITNEAHQKVAAIHGTVVHVSDRGEIYTRAGPCEIAVYDVRGSLTGKVALKGLDSACAAIRFDAYGNIYELDGIPDAAGQYNSKMPGMRVVVWERQ